MIENKNISYTSLITNEENQSTTTKKEDKDTASYISTSNITAINVPITKKIKQIHEMTKKGFAGKNQKKINQDTFFVKKNFPLCDNSMFIGVCDGHGVTGHEVSKYLKENLPESLFNEIMKKHLKSGKQPLKKIIEDVFKTTNDELSYELIDTDYSGSTCVSLIYTPEKIICANVGDSRCIMGRCINDSWIPKPLSRDHKPTEKDEEKRIFSKKGRIEPYQDTKGNFIGPKRVWLEDDTVPGLAMSRSFGDKIAATVGVIPVPEIVEWSFTKEDKFIVLASDGIWEFIDNQECVDIVKEFYAINDVVGACEFLVEEATRRWIREDEIIDDITVIVMFLDN